MGGERTGSRGRTMARSFGWGAFASVVGIPSRLVIGKLIGLYVGPAGEGLIASLRAHILLVSAPLNVASGPALVSNLAGALGQDDRARAAQVTGTAWTTALLLLFVLIPVAVLTFSVMEVSRPLVALAAVALTAPTLMKVPQQSLVSAQEHAAVGRGAALLAVASLCCVGGGVFFGGVTGYFVGMVAVGVLGVAFHAAVLAVQLPWLSLRPALSFSVLLDMGKVAASQSTATVAENLGLLFIYSVVREGGEGDAAVGLFAAAWTLARVNLNIIMKSVGMFVFPRYAAATSNEVAMEEVRAATRLMLQLAPAVFIAAVSLREWVVWALKSEAYAGAATMLALLVTGDLFRTINYLHVSTLLYRKRLLAYSLLSVGQWITFSGLVAVLAPQLGLDGAGVAYLATYALWLVPSLGLVATQIARPHFGFLPALLGVAALCGGAFWLTATVPHTEWAIAVVCGAWLTRSDLAKMVFQAARRRLGR